MVAQEIKVLADQSRSATQRIQSILEDTRKWVSTVVMASEHGAKAVHAGAEQSSAAEPAIQDLSRSIADSAQEATVIETTSEQQSVGIDQVSTAIAHIQSAMEQVTEGTRSLNSAVERLRDLRDYP